MKKDIIRRAMNQIKKIDAKRIPCKRFVLDLATKDKFTLLNPNVGFKEKWGYKVYSVWKDTTIKGLEMPTLGKYIEIDATKATFDFETGTISYPQPIVYYFEDKKLIEVIIKDGD